MLAAVAETTAHPRPVIVDALRALVGRAHKGSPRDRVEAKCVGGGQSQALVIERLR